MFFVEFCPLEKVRAYGDEAEWQEYQPGFQTEERAHNEALWLSIDDDGRYVYRVIERAVAA